MQIELHPEADAEFAHQVDYYEDREAGLGERFYREVIACLHWIAENPLVPRLRENLDRHSPVLGDAQAIDQLF